MKKYSKRQYHLTKTPSKKVDVTTSWSTSQLPQTITTKITNRKTKEKETLYGSVHHTVNM